MKIDIIIASAAGWDERRKAPLERLVCALPGTPLIVESKVREHASVWARNIWRTIASVEAPSPSLPGGWIVLNDDVEPHPEMVPYVEQLAKLLPGEVISLHGNFPSMKTVADDGHRLARCYWASGPAMWFHRGAAAEILGWLETVPPDWFGGEVNEDGVIASWLWSKQKPAYVSIPSLVRHDVTVPSTLPGYDEHPHRQTYIDWKDYPLRAWSQDDVDNAPYVPVPWVKDQAFAHLALALRGVVPLCGICRMSPASYTNHNRKTGVCTDCATKIASCHVSGARQLESPAKPRGAQVAPGQKPTFALAIPHAPWVKGRVQSILGLLRTLGRTTTVDVAGAMSKAVSPEWAAHCRAFCVFHEKEPCEFWSERIWSWFEAQETSHAVQLQDDTRVPENFWPALSALVQAFPEDVIALHSMHTGARALAREGIHAYTTTDGLVGVGYVIPKSVQPAFRDFRENELKPGARHACSEDTVLAMFCMATGRRIVSPCPTILDHDLGVPSSAGPERERQDFRRPAVTWEDLDVLGGELADLEKKEYWLAGGGPTHLGTFYPAVEASCLMHCRSFTMADAERARMDVCPPRFQRFLRMG